MFLVLFAHMFMSHIGLTLAVADLLWDTLLVNILTWQRVGQLKCGDCIVGVYLRVRAELVTYDVGNLGWYGYR